jgi:Rhodopirellula transposase DDE domain
VVDASAIQLRFEALDPVLDERSRRRFAAAEACAAGRGGIVLVSRITGIARSTINRGLAELGEASCGDLPSRRVRRAGGGRKKLSETDPTLLSDLQDLVEPTTRGDPQAPLLWTSRSLRNLAEALQAMGHRIGHNVVADLLRQLNYSLQGNRKTREGSDSPDRDEQFDYIARRQGHRSRHGGDQPHAAHVPRENGTTPSLPNWNDVPGVAQRALSSAKARSKHWASSYRSRAPASDGRVAVSARPDLAGSKNTTNRFRKLRTASADLIPNPALGAAARSSGPPMCRLARATNGAVATSQET